MTEKSTMHIDLRVGETFTIGGVAVTLAEKSGQRARLTVHADKSIAIHRPGRKPEDTTSAQECASLPIAKEQLHG